jgi:hypothetical protein
LKVLKVGAVWGVWKPRFPTPLVWDRFREGWFDPPSGRGVLGRAGPDKDHVWVWTPPGEGGGWFGGVCHPSFPGRPGRMASGGGLGPCPDGPPRAVQDGSGPPPGRVWERPSQDRQKSTFRQKTVVPRLLRVLGTLRAFFPRKPTQGPKSRLFLEFLDSWFRTVWTAPRAVQDGPPGPSRTAPPGPSKPSFLPPHPRGVKVVRKLARICGQKPTLGKGLVSGCRQTGPKPVRN